MCHGIDGVASRIGRGAVDLNDPEWQRRTSEEQIVKVIEEGRGQMPAWKSRLSEQEIRDVAGYVKTLR
jgi:mono/diheme cytochrome c family protein